MSRTEVKLLKFLYEHRGRNSSNAVAEAINEGYDIAMVAAWNLDDNGYATTIEVERLSADTDDKKETIEITTAGIKFVESNPDLFK